MTKYLNITEISTGQKKLIVDDLIVPAYPVFDYKVMYSTPPDLTADVVLDGVSHSHEVLYGAIGEPNNNKLEEVASICIRLGVKCRLQLPIRRTKRQKRHSAWPQTCVDIPL